MMREARYSERLKEEVRSRTRELAARNAELEIVNSRLEQASLTDPLTKLGNRRVRWGGDEFVVVRSLSDNLLDRLRVLSVCVRGPRLGLLAGGAQPGGCGSL